MAIDNSTTPTAPAAVPDYGDLLNALLDIKGTVQISRRAVYNTMNISDFQDPEKSAEILQAVEGALTLAEAAIERLYEQLDRSVSPEGWLRMQADEVVHVNPA